MSDPRHLESLMADCARGQEAALAELYRLCAPHLFAVAIRILRRNDWAEEVMQECFITIWQNAARYSTEQSQVMTWMTRIVRNRCIDLLRRPDLERPDPDGEVQSAWADEAPGPLGRLQLAQDGRRLAGCMAELDGPQRMAIALSFFEELSHSEIAQKLGSPIGTVKSWVRRGMERLKRCLS
ncbi:MAG: sigma-70 family RNA polymerase sigma factor [Burkholderiaceae bacterium]|nr:sigma-70 family RNA polymerase sigma factor [Burkholderiaceae bacterium]